MRRSWRLLLDPPRFIGDANILQPVVARIVAHDHFSSDFVAGLKFPYNRWVFDAVRHRHRRHESWNVAMLHGNLSGHRVLRDHFALQRIFPSAIATYRGG